MHVFQMLTILFIDVYSLYCIKDYIILKMKRNQTKNVKYFDNFQYLIMAKLFIYSLNSLAVADQTKKLEKKITVLYTSKYNVYLLTLTSLFIFLK